MKQKFQNYFCYLICSFSAFCHNYELLILLLLTISCIQVVTIDPMRVDSVIDTTGAGDAFLGGLIVGRFTDYYAHYSVTDTNNNLHSAILF